VDVCAVERRVEGGADLAALLRKWLSILPRPFTAAGWAAGCRYDIAIW
jgi:hypothetical protein